MAVDRNGVTITTGQDYAVIGEVEQIDEVAGRVTIRAGKDAFTVDSADTARIDDYLLTSGDRAMNGDLDMGTNDILNLGAVNGWPINSHASRHESGGGDAMALQNIAVSGNLNLGGFQITNVGNVDGVDVSAHGPRHELGGADEISVAGLSGRLYTIPLDAVALGAGNTAVVLNQGPSAGVTSLYGVGMRGDWKLRGLVVEAVHSHGSNPGTWTLQAFKNKAIGATPDDTGTFTWAATNATTKITAKNFTTQITGTNQDYLRFRITGPSADTIVVFAYIHVQSISASEGS